MKEVTLYVDLLICMLCRGSNMTGYFPFPSRVGLRPRYGFSFCMVCTRRPRRSPVSQSVKLSPRACSPNIKATPRTIRPIMLLAFQRIFPWRGCGGPEKDRHLCFGGAVTSIFTTPSLFHHGHPKYPWCGWNCMFRTSCQCLRGRGCSW